MSNWMHYQIRELYEPTMGEGAFDELVKRVRRVNGQAGVDYLMSLVGGAGSTKDTEEREEKREDFRWIERIDYVMLIPGRSFYYHTDGITGVLIGIDDMATIFRDSQPVFTTHISNVVIFHKQDEDVA